MVKKGMVWLAILAPMLVQAQDIKSYDKKPEHELIRKSLVFILIFIVYPKIKERLDRAEESRLKSLLKLRREAVERFRQDTGAFPATWDDIFSSTAPKSGLDSNGNPKPIYNSSFRGPYLKYPRDFGYLALRSGKYRRRNVTYFITAPKVGQLQYEFTTIDSEGKPMNTW